MTTSRKQRSRSLSMATSVASERRRGKRRPRGLCPDAPQPAVIVRGGSVTDGPRRVSGIREPREAPADVTAAPLIDT